MGRFSIAALAVLAAAGSWLLLRQPQPAVWWSRWVSSHDVTGAWVTDDGPSGRGRSGVIRIATIDLDGFDEEKLAQGPELSILVRIMKRFDVVAMQNIVSPEPHVIPGIVDALNGDGDAFGYVASERNGRVPPFQQFACVFRRDRVLLDPNGVYSVRDPDDLITFDPFVASFRCQGVEPKNAFTVSLVNLLLDENPDESAREVRALWSILGSVRRDGRGEDDVILLGNLRRPAGAMDEGVPPDDAAWAIVERPTTADGTGQAINIVGSRSATVEFTGRSGVVDLVREFNLSLDQAQQISRFLPVWAEYSIVEGQAPGL
ncbi:MAG TPA: hypothetical protein VIY86_13315 [Pirellulaceae bacterium]